LPKLNFNFKNLDFLKVLKLMGPAVYGSAVYQLNVLAMTFFASYLPTGTVSYLWYGDRIMEFPLGIFAIAVATVALPTLSEHASKKEIPQMKEALRQSLSLVWFLNLPASLGLILLGKPIVALLFERGDFLAADTNHTAQTLTFFALGLPFLATARVMVNAFYAIQEAKKPVHAANISVVVNVLLAALLMHPLQHRGLALAVSLGAFTNMFFLFYFYRKKVGLMGLGALKGEFFKITLASCIMAGFLFVLRFFWAPVSARLFSKLLVVLSLVGSGVFVYFLALFFLKSNSLQFLWKGLKKRLA
ncbi:MAG: murein biosynthesis integral membrane protein MurJ, partial [Deltaproteobacteria bacterium]|nr:murein biosynthesis integral membrane protein MurJ [Deltaproteobacteria bacterium]